MTFQLPHSFPSPNPRPFSNQKPKKIFLKCSSNHIIHFCNPLSPKTSYCHCPIISNSYHVLQALHNGGAAPMGLCFSPSLSPTLPFSLLLTGREPVRLQFSTPEIHSCLTCQTLFHHLDLSQIASLVERPL